MSNTVDILSAVRRSDQSLCEQVAQWESLEFGVAYTCASFPSFVGGNQLRDAWLAEIDGPTAFERAEAYYRERSLTCLAWTPAAGQAIEPLEALLVPKGWRRVDRLAMSLADWGILDVEADAAIRVLPARAMPRAYHQSYVNAGMSDDEVAAAVERLNDSNYDAFVALVDGKPAGRIGYLEVGDIARLAELFVAPAFRGNGIGKSLTRHVLQLARRLLPRAVVTSASPEDEAGVAFLQRAGFTPVDRLTQFLRPL